MDIDFLLLKDDAWSYRDPGQQVLVDHCAALLNWDLFRFDRWLFDSSNWSMYTRRRQKLMYLRTDLAHGYAYKTTDLQDKEILLADFCIKVWTTTRSSEFRAIAEIKDVESAYMTAKEKRISMALQKQSKRK